MSRIHITKDMHKDIQHKELTNEPNKSMSYI